MTLRQTGQAVKAIGRTKVETNSLRSRNLRELEKS